MSEHDGARGSRRALVPIVACGLGLQASFVAIVFTGDLLQRFETFLLIFGVATVLWLLALSRIRRSLSGRQGLAVVLGGGLLFHVTLLFAEPGLSGDIHRYVWDGVVLGDGLSPYEFAPAAPERAAYGAYADRVNHPEISTIYPPLAEVTFALATMVAPTARAVRVALVLTQALLLLGLARMLKRRGRPLAEIAGVAWCPLVVLETAGGGHLDILPIGLLLLALSHLSEGRKNLSMWLFTASALCKYFALAVVVAIARHLGARRSVGVFVLFGLAYLPFLASGGPFRGLGTYAQHWHFNSPAFDGLVRLFQVTEADERLKNVISAARSRLDDGEWLVPLYDHVYPQKMSRMVIASLFAGLVALLAARGVAPERAAAWLVYGFVVLTPTLHPWYVLWALPFAVLGRSRAFLALAGLVVLAYAPAATVARGGEWAESPILLAMQFVPFAILTCLDLWRARHRPAFAPAIAARTMVAGRSPRLRRPGSRRRSITGPPSPFRRRPFLRRFREDVWPRWCELFGVLWNSALRWPMVIAMIAVTVLLLARSVHKLPAVEGRLRFVDGAAVVGAEVDVLWYVARNERVAKVIGRASPEGRPSGAVLERATELRRSVSVTGPDGRFAAPESWALSGPGAAGPYLRLHIRAPDPVSGEPYEVRRLRLGPETELPGTFDSRSAQLSGDWRSALNELELPPPGRVREIAVAADRIVTAEGGGGVRLYRLNGVDLELVAHRPAARGEIYGSAGFVDEAVLLFQTGRVEIAAVGSTIETRSEIRGAYERLVQATPVRWVIAAGPEVAFLQPGDPPQLFDSLHLGDAQRKGIGLGPELLRMSGSLLFYRHSDGSVRVSDVDGAFRTPATLVEVGGPVVDFVHLVESGRVLVASTSGITLYDVSRPTTRRVARVELDLDILALRGNAAIGQRGVVMLRIDGDRLRVGRRIEAQFDEVEAASAFRAGDQLVVPDVHDLRMRSTSQGLRWDLVRGTSHEQFRRLRDSVSLRGAVVIDLENGAVERVELGAPVRVVIRQDGTNRALVHGLVASTSVYARSDGRLHPVRWLEPAG